jgi:hypothetical protein
LGEISTWNHTVAAFVKAVPDLHHYMRHNLGHQVHEPRCHVLSEVIQWTASGVLHEDRNGIAWFGPEKVV